MKTSTIAQLLIQLDVPQLDIARTHADTKVCPVVREVTEDMHDPLSASPTCITALQMYVISMCAPATTFCMLQSAYSDKSCEHPERIEHVLGLHGDLARLVCHR